MKLFEAEVSLPAASLFVLCICCRTTRHDLLAAFVPQAERLLKSSSVFHMRKVSRHDYLLASSCLFPSSRRNWHDYNFLVIALDLSQSFPHTCKFPSSNFALFAQILVLSDGKTFVKTFGNIKRLSNRDVVDRTRISWHFSMIHTCTSTPSFLQTDTHAACVLVLWHCRLMASTMRSTCPFCPGLTWRWSEFPLPLQKSKRHETGRQCAQ